RGGWRGEDPLATEPIGCLRRAWGHERWPGASQPPLRWRVRCRAARCLARRLECGIGASPGGGAGPAVALIPNPLVIPVGVVMGILLAMPFGPINPFGIPRAAERGVFGGMAAGIGIMAGDGMIALGAALGVNAITGAIRQYRTAIQIVGGVALLGFGIKLCLTRAAVALETSAEKASLRDYIWDI